MRWRRWNTILHRDLGYLCFGLTVIYALSGVAVNHIADWNPNYRLERQASLWSAAELSRFQGKSGSELADAVLTALGVSIPAKGFFQEDPSTIKVFVEGNTISANLATGQVVQEKVAIRPILHAMNFLHLNHPKKLWTWFADLYAVALFTLAVSGLFVLPGKKGISGRGAWLTALGLVIPLLFLWLYSGAGKHGDGFGAKGQAGAEGMK